MDKMTNEWKNRFIKLAACFILSKKKRRKFREKHLYINYKDGNQVLLILPDGREKQVKHKIKGINVIFKGKNNTLKINEDIDKIYDISVTFEGNESVAIVKSNTHCCLCSYCFYKMDRSSSINPSGKMWVADNNAKITIGKNCIISWNVEFMGVDHHTLLDKNGKVCNYPEPIEIKDHVWIGSSVKICKGVTIAENNMIGMGSVVTKSFLETNCVIAGNPAKIVKRNVNWDVDKIYTYVQKHPEAK